jgi:hypothetical protein
MLTSLARVFLCTFLLVTLAPRAIAEPNFIFETGTPPWKGERLELPPGFAPDLGWTGVEQICFAPGMFKAGEADFFSYVLVFLLESGSEVSKAALERELLVYYRGLSKAVMAGKEPTPDTSIFTIALAPSNAGKGAPLSAPTAATWAGTLSWIEPFATQQLQTLHLELHVWEHEGKPVVLSCVSPVDPGSDAATSPWKTLREIRSAFRFEP